MDLTDLNWRKAMKSGENGGACVELSSLPDVIAVRDSKDPSGPKLIIDREDFKRFAEALKSL
ncbi:DUF397 domain-containing protein [Actinomadura bangladeshensis]|uniref:DUF397 domain-containing protein n=1 Tax=Actinomadura bangladeshensis TaxID=453573 RepID=A0A6L9QEJ5_9ACTN|nr:DUF397 domain-containing protein [Actinomadura bangladeshensis]NEA23889.1 DUF397 domain-containing protein [Actinomadura bangladeshensis]